MHPGNRFWLPFISLFVGCSAMADCPSPSTGNVRFNSAEAKINAKYYIYNLFEFPTTYRLSFHQRLTSDEPPILHAASISYFFLFFSWSDIKKSIEYKYWIQPVHCPQKQHEQNVVSIPENLSSQPLELRPPIFGLQILWSGSMLKISYFHRD